jgi:hypothetical protein
MKRFLVGLRWWTEIDDNGKETWMFESQEVGWTANNVDSTIFWVS